MKLTELMTRAAQGGTVEEVLSEVTLPAALRKRIRREAAAGAREAMLPLVALVIWLARR